MRIIGGSDYYDSAQAYGFDPTIIFQRQGSRLATDADVHDDFGIMRVRMGFNIVSATNEASSRKPSRTHLFRQEQLEVRSSHGAMSVRPMHVVLCGKLYSGLTVVWTQNRPYRQEVLRIWRLDALRVFCAQHGLALIDGPTTVAQDWGFDARGIRYAYDVQIEGLEDWFTPVALTGKAKEALIVERITIMSKNPEPLAVQFDRQRPWIIDGPTLSELGFAKALEPTATYQEISMWISGVLGSAGPGIIEITDDKIKLAKAGFHDPSSFRRAKTTR